MSKFKEYYSFDDVLIEPSYSNVIPDEVNVTTNLTSKIILKAPFITSAMDTITEHKMAIEAALLGGIGAIHRNLSIDLQCQEVKKVKDYKVNSNDIVNASIDSNNNLRVIGAIGIGEEALKRAQELLKLNIDAILIDSSHGHSQNVIDTIIEIKKISPDTEIIAGNIVTKNAAFALLDAGATSLKVGIGPGSICTTRIVSGVGVPQLSSILEVSQVCKEKNSYLIADGGIRCSGDIAKSIAAGADCVMLGSLIAATDVTPGRIVVINGIKYKMYRGMGSVEAMNNGSSDRYFYTNKKNLVSQGISSYIKYKGSIDSVIKNLIGGLRSSMGYTGNKKISDMKKKCSFLKVTYSAMRESHIHSLDSPKKNTEHTNDI